MTSPVWNRRRLLQGAAVAGITASGLTGTAHAQQGGAADLVLSGGRVLTLNRGFRIAEAVAIKDGRVIEVGDNRSVRRLIGRRTDVIDLCGRTVMPGVNDSHAHGLRTGLALPPYTVDVGKPAISAVTEAVAAAIAQVAPGAWIRGKGWDEKKFAEGRPPTRQDLDQISPGNPVALLDWSNHQLWVNSVALRIAGITRDTPDPGGGVIVRDSAGEPTGLLLEGAARLVNERIPAFTEQEQADAIERNISLLLSHGITSYTEPGIGAVAQKLYADKARRRALRIRVTALLSRPDDTYPVSVAQVREILAAQQPLKGIDRRWLNIAGVKLRADGVPIGSRTAWMREPYVGGGRGGLLTVGASDSEKVAELTAMVALVHRAGLQIGTHATGDAAIDAVATAYASSRPSDQRHYVIHGDFAWPETLRLLARNRCGVSFNPNIKRLIADTQPGVVGPERAAYQTPYQSALRAGVQVTSASDTPNVSPHWLQGLETILLREGNSGTVSGPEQRIGVQQALRTYTTAGAWQDHADHWKGSLEPGMAADLCVLDGTLLDERGRLAVDAHAISDIPVAMTLVDGSVVYDSSDKSARAAATAAQNAGWARNPNPEHMCANC
ncbi:putative amidohydrolase YtcJ [Kibdelosporangium banguiense]|uniref:Amidohydrolase YtcJ n=1 Tax=Kibdelosporangium banguiense TaxID=1365924 RepID=A0ABS4U2G1_9PSEU|nr:amidohydrolase [Kibdelosporangium banguiense]MBP2330380.1 putative amidohydrolase YtcJ [Kibdelosporangium banguiense]